MQDTGNIDTPLISVLDQYTVIRFPLEMLFIFFIVASQLYLQKEFVLIFSEIITFCTLFT